MNTALKQKILIQDTFHLEMSKLKCHKMLENFMYYGNTTKGTMEITPSCHIGRLQDIHKN